MTQTYSYFASAPRGVESILAGELRDLGASGVKRTRAGVYFEGDLGTGYRACLWLRTASRLFMVIESFEAETTDDLYDGIRNIDWSEHMNHDNTLAINFHENQSIIKHTHFGALKVKDAIVDQFRDRYSLRPSIDLDQPDIRINVFMERKFVTVSLDLSGSSLHKRGYRMEKGLAPLKENLAAAILIKAGWPEIAGKGGGFIDPMCGSGTLPIEAAMIAGKMAPGLLRDYFGFLKWQQHSPDLWEGLVNEAEEMESRQRDHIVPVVGYDRDSAAIRDSITNLERAGLHGLVHFEKRALAELVPHSRTVEHPGLIMANPPYGERLGNSDELKQLYSELGRRLKTQFMGWQAALFTGNPPLAREIKIKPVKIDHFFNGTIPCDLIQYNIDAYDSATISGIPAAVHGNSYQYEPSEEIQMFENRVKKNLKKLKSWLRQNNISCFRAYDRDIPEYSVAVDVYDKWIHVQEYRAPSSVPPEIALRRIQDVVYTLPSLFEVPAENIIIKQRRKQKNISQYEKQDRGSRVAVVMESGLKFEINLDSYIDTGLFPDHRPTRAMIEAMAKGKRFLNLFSYTSTATVYAARGGAVSTTSVDKSNTYTKWAKRNMSLNGFDKGPHNFISEDCLEWIRKERSTYDLIFLDPPTFSNSKKSDVLFDIQKDHADLILNVMNLLAPDGVLIFSNNFRQFKMDLKKLGHLKIEDITQKTIPRDFERNPKIHNCRLIRR